MQIVINFNEIDLADWVEDFDSELPTLKEIFKEEILNKFVEKINYDSQVRKYIEKNIDDNLYLKIYNYKDDVAIKTIVSEIIKDKLRATGSFIFLDRYAEDVKRVVDEYFKEYPQKMERAMCSSVRLHIENTIDEMYKGSKMGEFIDKKKLSSHIFDILSTKDNPELLKGGVDNDKV